MDRGMMRRRFQTADMRKSIKILILLDFLVRAMGFEPMTY
jgi:hypothetical protein